MKKHLFDVSVEQIKKYVYKKRAISIYKCARTEYKKKNGVSILGEIVLERGANLESWAAHTHPF